MNIRIHTVQESHIKINTQYLNGCVGLGIFMLLGNKDLYQLQHCHDGTPLISSEGVLVDFKSQPQR